MPLAEPIQRDRLKSLAADTATAAGIGVAAGGTAAATGVSAGHAVVVGGATAVVTGAIETVNRLRQRPKRHEPAQTLGGLLIAVRALLAVERALRLDDVWTYYLQTADPKDREGMSRDVPPLRSLVDEMVQAIYVLSRSAMDLCALYSTADSEQVRVWINSLGDLIEDRHRAKLLAIEQRGFRSSLISACDYIHDHAHETENELRAKLAVLERGQFHQGDLPELFKCAAYIVQIAGGAIWAWKSKGKVAKGAGLANVVGGALTGFDPTKCF